MVRYRKKLPAHAANQIAGMPRIPAAHAANQIAGMTKIPPAHAKQKKQLKKQICILSLQVITF